MEVKKVGQRSEPPKCASNPLRVVWLRYGFPKTAPEIKRWADGRQDGWTSGHLRQCLGMKNRSVVAILNFTNCWEYDFKMLMIFYLIIFVFQIIKKFTCGGHFEFQ